MNYSKSQSHSMSRDIEENQRTGGLPTQLRALPGYTSSYTPAPASTPAPAPPPVASVAPSAGRYQTRERLYYETDTVLPSRTVKPASVVARMTDDAPPTLSLHEYGSLTPEHKYATSKEEIPREEFSLAAASTEPAMPSEGNWVTVFGFSGAQSAAVLGYFQKLGVVEQSENGQGNWIHLQYSTRWAAQKALAKNGTVLPVMGTCMIGVVPTTRAMEQVGQAAESFMSPLKKESIRRTSQDQTGDIFIKPGMAPIATTQDGMREATPARDEGSVVTKALGFVFGW